MKYIYCFTNLINNKQYIGSTINDPQRRYSQHLYNARHLEAEKNKYPLYQAINKYGIENFKFEVLLSKDCSEEEIREIERDYIIKYNTLSPCGYNQTLDTCHPIQDIATYKKISETKRENAKRVIVYDQNENIVGKYRSIADCAEALQISEKHIGSCCRGERLTSNGMKFYWLDDDNSPIIPKYNREMYKGAKGTTQIQSTSKKVAKIDLKTEEILDIYDTIALAARENNCDASGISKVCRGKRNQSNGYKWRYIDE